ncbi:MAG: hypothetical protein WB988_20320 [Candidatus Nitrosopolaris sp.]|jgi:hypothetical protein
MMTIAPEMTEPEMTKPQTDGPIPTEQQEELELQGFKQRKAYWEEEQRDDDNKDDLCHGSASKDATIDSLPENVKSIARNLRIAVDQMHLGLTKAKELILETARQLDEEHLEERAKICKKIKEILKDKIQEGKISEGWIEECLPREYKRKYTRTESQQNHLSGGQQPELVVSTNGNQISESNKPSDIDSNAPDTEVMSSLLGEDQSLSVGEASPVAVVDQSSYNQLKTNTKSSTVDDFASSGPLHNQTMQECSSCLELQDEVSQLSEALQRISIKTADQVPATGHGLTIPREKYQMVRDAMDRSKSKKFVRAEPDMYH